MSIFSGVSNPGLDFFQPTQAERDFWENLAGLSYSAGDVLYHDGTDFVNLAIGSENEVLAVSAGGIPEWTTAAGAGSGDVVGPASSTDNAVARFDGTTGKLLQDSPVLIDDTGNVSGVGTLSSGAITSTGASSLGSLTLTTDLAVADGGTGASTAAGALINLGLTADAAELNILDGATLTVTELNFVDGVTSAIQTQIDGKQASDADLTAIAALSSADSNFIVGSATGWVAETGATVRTSLGLAIGTDVQAWDADLDSWAAITRAAGFDTFVATPSSANLAALVTDETGSGALVFGTSPALTTPNLGTPSAATLTNATGLPLTGLVNDTTTALGVGTLELGHATDTTLSRSAAGVLAVEGADVAFKETTINAQTGTTYTLVLADASKHITMTNASANTLTVPPNSSVAFAVGTRLMIQQKGAGSTTIAAGSGVTINAPASVTLAIDEQYGSRGLIKTATNTWELI